MSRTYPQSSVRTHQSAKRAVPQYYGGIQTHALVLKSIFDSGFGDKIGKKLKQVGGVNKSC